MICILGIFFGLVVGDELYSRFYPSIKTFSDLLILRDYTDNKPIRDFTLYPDIECQVVADQENFLRMECLIGGSSYTECPFTPNLYYRIQKASCKQQTTISTPCPGDWSAYQMCGLSECLQQTKIVYGEEMLPGVPVCTYRPCRFKTYGWGRGHKMMWGTAPYLSLCDGFSACTNKVGNFTADEADCLSKDMDEFDCTPVFITAQSQRVRMNEVCDDKCDCASCSDEAECYGRSVGIFCKSFSVRFRKVVYIAPRNICDGRIHCNDGQDELLCATATESCDAINFFALDQMKQPLIPRSKCGPIATERSLRKCTHFTDQMNCSALAEWSPYSSSPLLCPVDGYPTTISARVVCGTFMIINKKLCDDGIDQECVALNSLCTIHKHQQCDGIDDCGGKADEGGAVCSVPTVGEVKCIRRYATGVMVKPIKLPDAWVLDGVSDCRNGLDEDIGIWFEVCGLGTAVLHSLTFSNCTGTVLLKCPAHPRSLLSLNRTCTDSSYCDRSLCLMSRRNNKLASQVTTLSDHHLAIAFCLAGLESIQAQISPCSTISFHNGVPALYTSNMQLTMPALGLNECKSIFGQLYVYLACTGRCGVPCPIQPLLETSCASSHPHRYFTINTKHQLTRVVSHHGTYTNDVFSCSNLRCVPYSMVCDLVDDCGDQSDEMQCKNHFKCLTINQFVARSRRCDGVFDCQDFSDECNEECTTEVKILPNAGLKTAAWTLGSAATGLNLLVLFQGFNEFGRLETNGGRKNKAFTMVISLGDFLQGVYLLCAAIGDTFFNKSTCSSHFEWLTNPYCEVLGVLSTIGSLISLYSMAILSVIKLNGVVSTTVPHRTSLNRRFLSQLLGGIVALILSATLVAVIPTFPFLKDFFVQRVVYEDNNLFVGSIDKGLNTKILQEYYGRFRKGDYSWDTMHYLVEDMFNSTGPQVKSLGFYGSSGICLFNFFVRGDNPHIWFVGAVQISNLICVIVIAVCYLVVNIVSLKSSRAAGGENNDALTKRNMKLQRKIAVIVSTDIISWIPFMGICVMHYTQYFDFSHVYRYFSILFLPCNSIVNPILINYDIFVAAWKDGVQYLRSLLETSREEEIEMEMTNRETAE